MQNFAVIGVGGYIAPRHLRAIKATGNALVAAADPSDSVGILDQFSYDVRYFREIERFDRHLNRLSRGAAEKRVDWVTVCSPNYLHDAHIRLALRNGANAICEKPLVINPWNLDALQEIEEETGKRIATVLQLRVHPDLIALRKRLNASRDGARRAVTLTYVTSRGPWYRVSWKGIEERSGGIATNIGIHFFDLLLWLFGGVREAEVHLREETRMAGYLELERASVRWYLSVERGDLPNQATVKRQSTYRSITVDGVEVEFSEGFAELHTRVYEDTLAGGGYGISDARPSIDLVHRLRNVPVGGRNERHGCLDSIRSVEEL